MGTKNVHRGFFDNDFHKIIFQSHCNAFCSIIIPGKTDQDVVSAGFLYGFSLKETDTGNFRIRKNSIGNYPVIDRNFLFWTAL